MFSSCRFLVTENYDLVNPEEKYDIIPEIWQGHNIADYIDPEIMKVVKFTISFLFLNLRSCKPLDLLFHSHFKTRDHAGH